MQSPDDRAGALATILGLIKAGANVTITGGGTYANPYVISATGGELTEITGLLKAGRNITFTGTGTSDDPYVINMVELADVLHSGSGIHLDGDGTVEHPAVISVILLGLIEAGTNITRTGIGVSSSPMILSANATGLVSAGANITLTGTGTATDPYVISSTTGQRGDVKDLETEEGWSAYSATFVKDSDGYVTISGQALNYDAADHPAHNEGDQMPIAKMPENYRPETYAVFAIPTTVTNLHGDRTWAHATVGVDLSGKVTLYTPKVPYGYSMEVNFGGVRYWPK